MLNNSAQWTTLQNHIETRLAAVPDGTLLKHHVRQLQVLVERVMSDKRTAENGAVTATFEALSGYWKQFDRAISQSLPSSPDDERLKRLETLNQQALAYYQRLQRVVPQGAQRSVNSPAPIFYSAAPAAGCAELTLFRGGFPALIGLPKQQSGEPVLAYAVARVFFAQLPALLAELQTQVQRQFPDLPETILAWLPDLAAKLAGIALLFNAEETTTQLLTPAKPVLFETEISDPNALLLPYIGLEALPYFLKYYQRAAQAGTPNYTEYETLNNVKDSLISIPDVIVQIIADLDTLFSDRLSEPFHALKASLRSVRSVVGFLCSDACVLQAFNGTSFGAVLMACAEDTSGTIEAVLPEWGRLAEVVRPAEALPLPFGCRAACYLAPTGLSFSFLDLLKSIFG